MTERHGSKVVQNCCSRCSGRKAVERQTDADHWTFFCRRCAAAYDAQKESSQNASTMPQTALH